MAAEEGKKIVLIGVDDSKESIYSLEWALDHLLLPASGASSPFKIILLHIRPSALSVLKLSGPGVPDVVSIVDKDLKRVAQTVVESAKELCGKRSIHDFEVEVVEGDARVALCEAVDKYHAQMLIVGSHGYGAFKRAILGSVSDYCAHHAHCSVLIVKKPKAKADH